VGALMLEYGNSYDDDGKLIGGVDFITTDLTGLTDLTDSFERVLDDIRTWLGRFILTIDESDLDLLTLWCAHTYLCLETYTTPRLLIDSPMPGSGKTTVLEHLSRLCLNPIQMASLSSPALLTRMLENGMRTILIDEVDRSLNPKNPSTADLLAVLNSGYKRGGTRPVLVPSKDGKWDAVEMPTFSPVAMAGNTPHLPDDTRSRSIRVLLWPDVNGDIEDSDWESIEEDCKALGARLEAAADLVRERVRTERPSLPEGTKGRIKERWYPLKRVAAVASERWGSVADELIVKDIEEARLEKEDGLTNIPPAISLLRDISTIWPEETPFLDTKTLVNLLISLSPTMWGSESQFGKDLTPSRLARMLVTGFKVHSERPGGGGTPRGYYYRAFLSAWRRIGVPQNNPVKPVEAVEAVEVSPDDPFIEYEKDFKRTA